MDVLDTSLLHFVLERFQNTVDLYLKAKTQVDVEQSIEYSVVVLWKFLVIIKRYQTCTKYLHNYCEALDALYKDYLPPKPPSPPKPSDKTSAYQNNALYNYMESSDTKSDEAQVHSTKSNSEYTITNHEYYNICKKSDLFDISCAQDTPHLMSHQMDHLEKTRFLYLHCNVFQYILALIEWCEWVSRFNSKYKDSIVSGTARCPHKPSKLNKKPVWSPETSKWYHLDIANEIPQGQSKFKDQLTSTHLNAKCRTDFKESMENDVLFESVWNILVEGRLGDLSAVLDNLGEQWIESLITGQIPNSNPDSPATVAFDSILTLIPSQLCENLNRELHESDRLLNNGNPETCAVSSAWPLRVVFEPATHLIRTIDNYVEEFSIGNATRDLLVSVANNACQKGERSMTIYERAFYGFLSGDFQSMIPACKSSWVQILWCGAITLQEKITNWFFKAPQTKEVWNLDDILKIFQAVIVCVEESVKTPEEYSVLKIVSSMTSLLIHPTTGYKAFCELSFTIQQPLLLEFLNYCIALYKVELSEKIKCPSIEAQWNHFCESRLINALKTPPNSKTTIYCDMFFISQIKPSKQLQAGIIWLLSWMHILPNALHVFDELPRHAFASLLNQTKHTFPLLFMYWQKFVLEDETPQSLFEESNIDMIELMTTGITIFQSHFKLQSLGDNYTNDYQLADMSLINKLNFASIDLTTFMLSLINTLLSKYIQSVINETLIQIKRNEVKDANAEIKTDQTLTLIIESIETKLIKSVLTQMERVIYPQNASFNLVDVFMQILKNPYAVNIRDAKVNFNYISSSSYILFIKPYLCFFILKHVANFVFNTKDLRILLLENQQRAMYRQLVDLCCLKSVSYPLLEIIENKLFWSYDIPTCEPNLSGIGCSLSVLANIDCHPEIIVESAFSLLFAVLHSCPIPKFSPDFCNKVVRCIDSSILKNSNRKTIVSNFQNLLHSLLQINQNEEM